MRTVLLLLLLPLYHAAAQQAPAPGTPLTPSEAHERLAFLIGAWTVEEEEPAAHFRESCDWLPSGRRHVVCQAAWETPTGPRAGISIFSFRAADSTYLYHGFRSGGRVEAHAGRHQRAGGRPLPF